MAKYRLTKRADLDIGEIYEYSILNFGLKIARNYISGLHEKCELLADNQSWGNNYDYIKKGLYRYEYRSHSIYYQLDEKGIIIVRILGNMQEAGVHF